MASFLSNRVNTSTSLQPMLSGHAIESVKFEAACLIEDVDLENRIVRVTAKKIRPCEADDAVTKDAKTRFRGAQFSLSLLTINGDVFVAEGPTAEMRAEVLRGQLVTCEVICEMKHMSFRVTLAYMGRKHKTEFVDRAPGWLNDFDERQGTATLTFEAEKGRFEVLPINRSMKGFNMSHNLLEDQMDTAWANICRIRPFDPRGVRCKCSLERCFPGDWKLTRCEIDNQISESEARKQVLDELSKDVSFVVKNERVQNDIVRKAVFQKITKCAVNLLKHQPKLHQVKVGPNFESAEARLKLREKIKREKEERERANQKTKEQELAILRAREMFVRLVKGGYHLAPVEKVFKDEEDLRIAKHLAQTLEFALKDTNEDEFPDKTEKDAPKDLDWDNLAKAIMSKDTLSSALEGLIEATPMVNHDKKALPRDEQTLSRSRSPFQGRLRSPFRLSPPRHGRERSPPYPERLRSRSPPSRENHRSRSPPRFRPRSRTPPHLRARPRSPPRVRPRSRSPGRFRLRSRSPPRPRSRSPFHDPHYPREGRRRSRTPPYIDRRRSRTPPDHWRSSRTLPRLPSPPNLPRRSKSPGYWRESRSPLRGNSASHSDFPQVPVPIPGPSNMEPVVRMVPPPVDMVAPSVTTRTENLLTSLSSKLRDTQRSEEQTAEENEFVSSEEEEDFTDHLEHSRTVLAKEDQEKPGIQINFKLGSRTLSRVKASAEEEKSKAEEKKLAKMRKQSELALRQLEAERLRKEIEMKHLEEASRKEEERKRWEEEELRKEQEAMARSRAEIEAMRKQVEEDRKRHHDEQVRKDQAEIARRKAETERIRREIAKERQEIEEAKRREQEEQEVLKQRAEAESLRKEIESRRLRVEETRRERRMLIGDSFQPEVVHLDSSPPVPDFMPQFDDEEERKRREIELRFKAISEAETRLQRAEQEFESRAAPDFQPRVKAKKHGSLPKPKPSMSEMTGFGGFDPSFPEGAGRTDNLLHLPTDPRYSQSFPSQQSFGTSDFGSKALSGHRSISPRRSFSPAPYRSRSPRLERSFSPRPGPSRSGDRDRVRSPKTRSRRSRSRDRGKRSKSPRRDSRSSLGRKRSRSRERTPRRSRSRSRGPSDSRRKSTEYPKKTGDASGSSEIWSRLGPKL